jgi:hypothetical protein
MYDMGAKILTTSFLLVVLLAFGCTREFSEGDIISPDKVEITKQKNDALLSDELRVNPSRIILNSRSSSNFIKTMYSGTIPSGYRIHSFDIDIFIEGVDIADAIDFEFCYVDNMFMATFRRADIVNNSFIRSLAGNTVTVISQGSYTLINSDNQTINVSFSKTGTAQILLN